MTEPRRFVIFYAECPVCGHQIGATRRVTNRIFNHLLGKYTLATHPPSGTSSMFRDVCAGSGGPVAIPSVIFDTSTPES